jgi:hypothetical protein
LCFGHWWPWSEGPGLSTLRLSATHSPTSTARTFTPSPLFAVCYSFVGGSCGLCQKTCGGATRPLVLATQVPLEWVEVVGCGVLVLVRSDLLWHVLSLVDTVALERFGDKCDGENVTLPRTTVDSPRTSPGPPLAGRVHASADLTSLALFTCRGVPRPSRS